MKTPNIKSKTLYLGSDHAGFKLKEKIKTWLDKKQIPYQDLGNLKYNKNDDYPDYAKKVAQKVAQTNSLGLLFCGSGHGMTITANKIKNIRAILACSKKLTKLSRQHNNANILCLPSRFLPLPQTKTLIKTFLTTPFSKEKRHLRRLQKIKRLEK